MLDIDLKQLKKTMEEYLYLYQFIDIEILDIKNKFDDEKEIKKEVKKLRKIKKIIDEVLDYFQKNDKDKYSFIVLRYFKKLAPKDIEEELYLNSSLQWRIKNDVIYILALVALKEKVLEI